MTECPRFNSFAELDKYLDWLHKDMSGPDSLPEQSIQPEKNRQEWIILADKIGDLKKTKQLLKWEHGHTQDGRLFSTNANNKDFIILESVSGAKFRVYAQYIPEEWTSNLNVTNIQTKKQCLSGDFKVGKIYPESEMKMEVSHVTDAAW